MLFKTQHCISWWHHQMEIFSTFPGEFPAQRPVTRSCDVCFDFRMNKRLSKQSWGWWFEMPSRPLWRHCYVKMAWDWIGIMPLSDIMVPCFIGRFQQLCLKEYCIDFNEPCDLFALAQAADIFVDTKGLFYCQFIAWNVNFAKLHLLSFKIYKGTFAFTEKRKSTSE